MKKVLLVVCSSLIWISCDKKDKVTSPQAPALKVTQSNYANQARLICGHEETNVLVVGVGDTMHFDFHIKGSEALSQLKLEAHENFNCHGHGRVTRDTWTYQNIVNIDDSTYEQQVSITVPIPILATLGSYHFKIQLLDVSGKEAAPIEYNVVLYNKQDTIAPDVVINAPALNDEHKLKIGDPLQVAATVHDNSLLSDGFFKLLLEDEQGKLTVLTDKDFPANAVNTASILETVIIPASSSKGHQHLVLEVYDSAGNVNKQEWSLVIE